MNGAARSPRFSACPNIPTGGRHFRRYLTLRALSTDLEVKVLTTSKTSAQQEAQRALATVRTSYEKVTGTALQDIAKLDDYAADLARALGDVELLKPHFSGKKLADIDFEAIKEVIKTAEGGEKRRELEQAIQAIVSLEALATHNLTKAKGDQAEIESLVDARDALLAKTRGDLFKRLYDRPTPCLTRAHGRTTTNARFANRDLADRSARILMLSLSNMRKPLPRPPRSRKFGRHRHGRHCFPPMNPPPR